MSGALEADGVAVRDLEWHIKAVEDAANDWGVQGDKVEGRFISALLGAIAASGRLNEAARQSVERVMADAKACADRDLKRVELTLVAADKTMALGKQATQLAVAANERGHLEFKRSVGEIASQLSEELLKATQEWLVIGQNNRGRRDRWTFGLLAAFLAVACFTGGVGARMYDETRMAAEIEAFHGRIVDCEKNPVPVREAKTGGVRSACWLTQIQGARRD